jgi:hypothetical protein
MTLHDYGQCVYGYYYEIMYYESHYVESVCLYIAEGSMAGFRFLEGQDFSLLHSVQTGSEAHPASYPMGTRGSFPGVTAAGARS